MHKILLIEDDKDVRALIHEYFISLYPFAELFEAENGGDGLDILNKYPIDCVLLDYNLPDFDGIIFLELLATNKHSAKVPVIMLTAGGNEKVAVDAFKRGVSDYILKKDVTSTVLLRSITKAVKESQDYLRAQYAEKALIQSEARNRDLLDNATDLIQSISSQGDILYVNNAWCQALGYKKEELKYFSAFDVIHPDSLEHCQYVFKRIMNGESVEATEVSFLTKNGEKLTVEGNINCQFVDGEPVATRGIFRDISRRNAAEQALLNEKERLLITLNSIGDAVITTDKYGYIEFMNPVAERLSACKLSSVKGKPLVDYFTIVHEDTKKEVSNPILECLLSNEVVIAPENTVLINHSGDFFSIKESAAPIRTSTGEVIGAVMVFQDVTESRSLAKKIHYQSQHDALTGLVNRREFEVQLNSLIHSADNYEQDHVLCFLDLDNFKIVNDTAGHVAGDALLKQISYILGSKLRSSDTLARLGGDEFGILMESCPLEKAQSISEELVSTIRGLRFTWDEQIYDVGVSIGLVPITKTAESTTQLLAQADVACYTAKNRGRNQVAVYVQEDPGDTVLRSHKDLIRAASLRDALENDKFCLYVQEINTLGNGNFAYEILLRLRDKDGSLILPGSFIPAAERFNLMGEIDRWVIKTALHEYVRIFDKDKKTKITINLSGNSLIDDELLEYILSQFASSGVDTKNVCFEITETAAISNLAEATQLIKALKSHGCMIALDDFGSGMSSFNYLKQFPIDFLKIDGSFMREMRKDSVDYAVVESINKVGHIMGLKTIAEWVENQSTLNYLSDIGVDYFQGHVNGLPHPFTDLLVNS